MPFEQRLIHRFDWILTMAAFLVPMLGLIVLFSAGYDHRANDAASGIGLLLSRSPAALKQFQFFILSFMTCGVAALIAPRHYHRLAFFIYVVGLLLLLGVATFGTIVNGSRRWLTLGGVNIQPAEFMKLGVILALARVIAHSPPLKGGYSLVPLLKPSLILVLPMAFILKQPDLGTALSVGAVGAMMILFVGVRIRTCAILILSGIVLAIPVWYQLHPYQKRRILNLFQSDQDPRGTGYHIIQSKIAVGSGELFGKGYLQGTQTQLEFLPEHTTDFIFSVLAEEWGFMGCATVLIAYLFLLWALLRVAIKARDLFCVLVVVGVSFQLFFHAFVNIGMVVGVLPVVGIPLPLFSYGGSSVLSTLFGVGLVMSISLRRGREV